MTFTEFYNLNPKEYISIGEASRLAEITESELTVLLRSGIIKGAYNPPFSCERPMWWVNIESLRDYRYI